MAFCKLVRFVSGVDGTSLGPSGYPGPLGWAMVIDSLPGSTSCAAVHRDRTSENVLHDGTGNFLDRPNERA